MENVVIMDTETTGLDPSKGAKLIEFAAILYNIKHRVGIQYFSTLYPCTENPVQDINGIEAEATRAKMAVNSVTPHILEMFSCAEAVIAHNAEFDKKFLQQLPYGQILLNKQWICTKKDFKWPVMLQRNRLQDICQAMNVPYVDAHRALVDCQFIANCFSKVSDLDIRLKQAIGNSFSNSSRFV